MYYSFPVDLTVNCWVLNFSSLNFAAIFLLMYVETEIMEIF